MPKATAERVANFRKIRNLLVLHFDVRKVRLKLDNAIAQCHSLNIIEKEGELLLLPH
ncbi:MAG: hypothetical protein QNJ70_14990 [Xenococcaceae cyanobacterium MO_207.B15]|nr:hypothetical protein [Xenococcaceae cyanobacterium MO_207.B15]